MDNKNGIWGRIFERVFFVLAFVAGLLAVVGLGLIGATFLCVMQGRAWLGIGAAGLILAAAGGLVCLVFGVLCSVLEDRRTCRDPCEVLEERLRERKVPAWVKKWASYE